MRWLISSCLMHGGLTIIEDGSIVKSGCCGIDVTGISKYKEDIIIANMNNILYMVDLSNWKMHEFNCPFKLEEIHDVSFVGDYLHVVFTQTNEILTFYIKSDTLILENRITVFPNNIVGDDAVHLNSFLKSDIGYLVTGFNNLNGYSGDRKSWHTIRDKGFVGIATADETIVKVKNLRYPHSLIKIDDGAAQYALLETDKKCLNIYNKDFGLLNNFPLNFGWPRGLLRMDDYWMIGSSAHRDDKDMEQQKAVVYYLDLQGNIINKISLDRNEIYFIMEL